MRWQIFSTFINFLKTRYGMVLTLILVVSFIFYGCASTSTNQKTACGAILGALAGAAIGAAINKDDPGRGALIGAAAGATIGGITGYAWGKSEERQLASRQQVEQQVYQQTGRPVNKPVVQVQNAFVNPDPAKPGNAIKITISYQIYGPVEPSTNISVILIKDGAVLAKKETYTDRLGNVERSHEITLPSDATVGVYEVKLSIKNGTIDDQKITTFNVV